MAKNHKHPGVVVDYFVNGTGALIKSGDLVKFGDVAGVALIDIPNGAQGSIQLAEVFEVAKLQTDNMTQGKRVHLDHVNKRVQIAADDGGSPATAFVFAGVVTQAAGAGTATCLLKLNA